VLTFLLADASFSSGSDSPWPIVVFIAGMVVIVLGWMWMQVSIAKAAVKEVMRKSPPSEVPKSEG
jgi:uncharacterized protein (DUF983 family)